MSTLWLETIGVVMLAFGSLWVGVIASRVSKRCGLCTCAVVTLCILLIAAGRGLCYEKCPVLFALLGGRAKFMLLACLVPLGLAGIIDHLPRVFEKRIALVLTAAAIFVFGVFPFLGTAMAATNLYGALSHVDQDGVCRQSTSFTCGPASATTALQRFGIAVEEGQLAAMCRSCPWIGTTDYDLLHGVQDAGGDQVICTYHNWDGIKLVLADNQALLAMLPQNQMMNHCVAVVQVTERAVVIADPAEGQITLSKTLFEAIWNHKGILIELKPAMAPPCIAAK